MIRWLNILRELTKFRISLFATLSAGAGFILSKGGVSGELLGALSGVFFLSCGSCALNQYLEREEDGRMERTKGRPLPSGEVTPFAALLLSLGLIILGGFVLFFSAGGPACGLGLFAAFWYNGVYLFLKRRTTFAILPGAFIGAVPPAIGWVSAGGRLLDPALGAIAFFFFIWQAPHFWLLLLRFAGDYERAGLPSMARLFTPEQLTGITFIWILSTAASCLLIPLFILVHFPVVLVSLLATTLWLVWNVGRSLRGCSREGYLKYTFVRLNIYACVVISLLSLDRLLVPAYSEGNIVSRILLAVFEWV